MVRSSRAVARVTVTTCDEGSGYSKSALKKRWSERLRERASISLLPVQKTVKRRAAAAIFSKAKHTSRTAKHAAGKKRKVEKDDEVNTQQYPVSGNLFPWYEDSGYISPEYHPDADGGIPSPPISSFTKKKGTNIGNTHGEYMIKANQALEYYHEKHPGSDRYAPVYVNLKQFQHVIDKAGYYIHMNFTAENLETKAEKVFFAELLLPYEPHINEYNVTACDIIGPESLGGLRNVYVPNGILFVGDTMDIKNCYACYDDVKHPEGNSVYQAGHMGHCAYD